MRGAVSGLLLLRINKSLAGHGRHAAMVAGEPHVGGRIGVFGPLED